MPRSFINKKKVILNRLLLVLIAYAHLPTLLYALVAATPI